MKLNSMRQVFIVNAINVSNADPLTITAIQGIVAQTLSDKQHKIIFNIFPIIFLHQHQN